MDLIYRVLSRNEFIEDPPVLVDIGASESINPKWKRIAKFCVCIGFDADQRDMDYVVDVSKGYKKLYIYPSIVVDQPKTEENFYLTKSPYCSSILHPDNHSLQAWSFAELFDIEEKKLLPAIDLQTVLESLEIKKIDWFKTDSQGIDLRLFRSLDENLINRILVAEFEPGIIDAYKLEDKLCDLMAYMQRKPFWMSDIKIQGSQRISISELNRYFNSFEKKYIRFFLRTSPGWGEVTYLNTCEQPSFTKRDFLLAWVFAVIEKQYGFALEIISKARQQFEDFLFDDLEKFTLSRIKQAYLKLPVYFGYMFFQKIQRILGG